MSLLRRLFGAGGEGPAADEPIVLPAAAIYTHWDLGPEPLAAVEFRIGIHNDPGTEVGSYFAPWNGTIDGADFYLGIQTDVLHPLYGWTGKGAIFSTWWSYDLRDTRTAPTGFVERGSHEGKFVGVRRNVEWAPGEWVLRLARTEPDGDGDWFDVTFGPDGGEATWIGGLRFRRRHPAVPAAIDPRGTGFLELYAGAERYADIADWHLDAMAYGDGRRAVGARSEYPWYQPGRQVPNADTWYEAERARVHYRYGGATVKQHPPARLF